jgi:predicted acetyltransferase
MSEKIKLIIPTIDNKEEALRFKQSFFDAGEKTIDGSELLDRMESYEEWLSYVTDNANAESLRDGCVLTDTYFSVDCNGNIVGIIDFRYELNDFFKDFGHSGYSVLPAERRKGYATEMLRLIVEKAKAHGLKEIQLSALRSNIPSVKTIKKNGGVWVRSFDFHGNIADVFIIRL